MPRILLVEDNENNSNMLARRLHRRDFAVVIAAGGAEACTRAETEQPDLILMDMHLPDLDGWAVTRRLKSASKTRAIPIIALTADAMSGDREKALQAGCDEYETKPIELPRLLDKIQTLLQKRS